ncbi:hypothetical protein G7Z17_g3396 [Cylindrodendrum hubeiense]|uniref:Uncharacterized protein n=1 Tax=Cylindrodendrum hubeiense TaxID=595255 RepID=A0A9P5HB01_9HYPO|nr:hypothetical protein G7Z17_g3396 [Cylindrodendrum hubeiense]
MELRPDHQFDPFGPDAHAYDDDEIAGIKDIDWSDPASFLAAMGGPIPKCPSPSEVRQEATERSRKIFASYDTLNKILERHESTIQKRWAKKTRSQRLRILLKAWPEMPVLHRPDFMAFRKESQEQRESGTKYVNEFMWPYINQEDLSQAKSLLLLLNARGRTPPTAFAAADNDSAHLGKVTKALVPIFLNEHTMVLNRATSAEDYGKLLAWENHPDAFEWMHTRKEFIPGECLLILELQERLMGFLVECCQELLHDIPEERLISDDFPVQTEPRIKSESDSSGFESLAVLAAEAPYRVPAQLDLGRIELLLGARTSAAEDQLWTLREDPSYFAQQLLETKEHRQEMLKDTLGQPHPATRRGCEPILWSRITGNVLVEAYLPLELFSELHRQVRELQRLQKKFTEEISPLRDLPKEYLGAILKFRHYLNQAAKGPLNQLKIAVVASPPMRKFYVRESNDDVNSTKIAVRSKTGVKMNKIEEHLTWLLRTLWEDDKPLFFIRLPLVVDELERLIQAEPQAEALISSRIAEIIGDLSIISRCSRQLDIYYPWAQSFESGWVNWKDIVEKDFAQLSRPWGQIISALRDQNLVKVAKLSEPSPGKFTYPLGKRRTRENVDALRRAEANLDNVWIHVDRIMAAASVRLDGTAVQRLLSQPRMLRRTPEWVEPATSAKDKQVAAPDVDALVQPFSALFCSPLSTPASTVQPKAKTKTRGAPSQPQADAIEPQGTTEINPQQTLSVDARALKVFRTLFFNPAVTSSPGEVPWNDFLHAMASTGFKAEKLYGSAWQFSPTKLDVERSIHFHEPHPKGKMAFEVARRVGRRLTRAYGWSGGTFVLLEKK